MTAPTAEQKPRPKKPAAALVSVVAAVRPRLMRDRDAAGYVSKSTSWIRSLRAADLKAKREGRQPAGPAWRAMGKSIVYEVAELDRWIDANSIERGVVPFSNRGGA